MKDLLNLLSQGQNEDFDAIRIGLASPEMIRIWSSVKLKSLRPLTIAPLSPSAMVLFCAKIFGPVKGLRMSVWQVQASEAPRCYLREVWR